MSEQTAGSVFAQLSRQLADLYAPLVAAWPLPVAWERLPVRVDEFGYVLVGRWGGYRICTTVILGGNERVLLVPERHPTGMEPDGSWDYAWCYHPRAAVVALLVWDPATQGGPDGWERQVGDRRPGQTARGFPWTPAVGNGAGR